MSEKKKYTRAVTCPHCKKKIDRNIEPFVEHNNRYYHEECHNEVDAGSRDRRELLDYINELYKGKANFQLVSKQIKELIDEYGYTVKGIEMTLRYFYDIKGNSIKKSKGIGIVPFTYEEAREYFTKVSRISQSVQDKDLSKITKVQAKKTKDIKSTRKKIDIGGIE